MSLFDAFRNELIDIIEWTDDSRDTIVWRFPRHGNAIKVGARLVVRESQVAVFVSEGRVADVFAAGTYTLETRNIPVLSTLQGWKHGFESPFKAEVYFVNVRQFTDFKWGTKNPIMLRDPEFGPVRLRAFGGFAARVVDPPRFLFELVGTDPEFRAEEVENYLRQTIMSRLSSALGTATQDIPVLDLASHQQQIGARLASALSADLASVGLEIPQFNIKNISLPAEVEKALDQRSRMGIVGDMDRYSKFQAASAMEEAAGNPGSGMGEAMGMGMGLNMAQQMAQGSTAQGQPTPQRPPTAPGDTSSPPPLPEQWFVGINGQQYGPFPRNELAQQASRGQVTRATLVWKGGMAQWAPAGEVPELSALFARTPPPLPPT